jgi:hypothetical protein
MKAMDPRTVLAISLVLSTALLCFTFLAIRGIIPQTMVIGVLSTLGGYIGGWFTNPPWGSINLGGSITTKSETTVVAPATITTPPASSAAITKTTIEPK